ncbi:MAG: PLDc N-terminal domain-containing protein [Microbacteriaceae bacterium]
MLARVLFILGVIVIAVDIYAVADIILTQRNRLRLLNKVLWVAIVVVVTPIGAILWFLLGKSRRSAAGDLFIAPDDDPSFRVPETESADERIARLEEELRKLDDEDDSLPGTSRD